MAHIRADLEGVVVIQSRNGLGRPVVLKAGDKIPRGVTVGEHLVAASGSSRPLAPRPKVNPEKPEDPAPAPPVTPEPAPADGNDGEKDDDAGPDEPATDEPQGDGDDSPAATEQGEPVARPPASGPGSDKGAWRRFAQSLGLEVADDATRADLQAAVEAHEQATA